MTEEEEKEEFQQQQKDLLNEAKFLSCMHNIYKVKILAWKPRLTKLHKVCHNPDLSLKGNYVCIYTDENNQEKIMDAQTPWVDLHFDPVFLAYTQAQAYKSLELVPIHQDDQEVVSRSGFVNVASEKITIQIDNTVFHRVCYIPACSAMKGSLFEKDENGKFVTED